MKLETANNQSFLLQAVKHLKLPKYYTPKNIENKLKFESILYNPKWS